MSVDYRYAARELFGVVVPPGRLPLRPVRNADFKEVSLEVGGVQALRFASAYGFRNIQQLMRQMKGHRCVYDYVEVMACPSGGCHADDECLNRLQPQCCMSPARIDALSGGHLHLKY